MWYQVNIMGNQVIRIRFGSKEWVKLVKKGYNTLYIHPHGIAIMEKKT